jgi:hypothetical protein
LLDSIAKLIPAENDPLRRIERGCEHSEPLGAKMFGDTPKVIQPELASEAEDTVNQDDIHRQGASSR